MEFQTNLIFQTKMKNITLICTVFLLLLCGCKREQTNCYYANADLSTVTHPLRLKDINTALNIFGIWRGEATITDKSDLDCDQSAYRKFNNSINVINSHINDVTRYLEAGEDITYTLQKIIGNDTIAFRQVRYTQDGYFEVFNYENQTN